MGWMESHKLPWWIGFPASIGLSVMGIVAPTFLPIWAQAALFGAGAVAVIWSVFAGIWHWRRKPRTPSNPQPQKRATELAAEEINRAVQSAGTPQPATPMADVFALPIKHMFEQIAAQMEVNHASKLDEIRSGEPHASQSNATLREGLAYAAFGNWKNRTMQDFQGGDSDRFAEALAKFHQLASDGVIRSWGIPVSYQTTDVFRPIPKDHWGYATIDYLDALREKAFSRSKVASAIDYTDIRVNRAEFEREWPHG